MEESDQRLLSPWEQYLLENELPFEPDSELHAELHDAATEAEEEDETDESRVSSNTSKRPPNEREDDEFGTRIKYTLATSSLLAPRLEISLYPHSSTPPTLPRLEHATTTRREDVGMRERVEWGEGWENRGTRWIDHPLLRDAGVVGCWIVAYISSLVLLVFQQYFQTHKPTMESTTILPEPLVEEMAAETLDEGVDVKAGVLDSVVRLVAVSQQLDNRISRSLGGIREVENVGLGLGLSESQLENPLQSSFPNRNRVGSPLGFSTTSSYADESDVPELRDPDLRLALAQTISTISLACRQAQISLSTLAGDPNEDVADLELQRHEAEATRDREEAIQRQNAVERLESEWVARQPIASMRNKRSTWDGGIVAPFSSSVSKRASFGGERDGLVPIFGGNTPSGTPVKRSSSLRRPGERLRPQSLMIHQPMHFDESLLPISTTSSPRSRKIRRSLDSEVKDVPTMAELQASFEKMHLTRRAMLWKVLGLVERSISEKQWEEVIGVFRALEEVVEAELKNVKRATETEFGVDGLGSELLSRTNHKRTPSIDPLLNRSRNQPAPHPNSSPKLSSSTQSRRSSLANPLASSNFAPANPHPSLGPVASLAALDSQSTTMLTSLRSIVAKLHIVTSDAKAQLRTTRGGPEDDALIEQLLSTHDSIRGDIAGLQQAWEDSRISLRGVVRRDLRSSVSMKRDSWTTDGGEGAERGALRSILDAVEDDDDDLESTLFSSDLVTPDMSPRDRAAISDAKSEAFLPPVGLERIFEAVVDQMPATNATNSAGGKLSREERISVAKEKRASGSATGRRSSRAMEAGMVAELKDVLTLLKGRNRLPEEI